MTAKAIGKRIKAKGLGRLRWYCQMCEKQCRDENGFKCHSTTAGHQRQLQLFSDAPTEFIARFSATFLKDFVVVLRQRYGTSAVAANTVYQEYIKDRHHLHMNATKWTTLSDFVKELGREGHCRVEEREEGWWITYVDRGAAERNRRAREIDRARLQEEERAERTLVRQMQHVRTMPRESRRPRGVSPSPSTAHVDGDAAATAEPIAMTVRQVERGPRADQREGVDVFASLAGSDRSAPGDRNGEDMNAGQAPPGKRGRAKRSRWGDVPQKRSAIEEIMLAEQAQREAQRPPREVQMPSVSDEEPASAIMGIQRPAKETGWVMEGIVVKIMNKEVSDGAFYKSKGTVIGVVDKFAARVRTLDSGAVLELDQDDLETVIPNPGGVVMILNGKFRGSEAVIERIDIDNYTVAMRLLESDVFVRGVEYDDISRRAPDNTSHEIKHNS